MQASSVEFTARHCNCPCWLLLLIVDFLLLVTNFKNKELLHKCQRGFRDVFSTDTCLIYRRDLIRKETDQDNYVGMLLLDFQKASDTIDHTILIKHLSAAGLGKGIVRWFILYNIISDKQQMFISLDHCHLHPLLPMVCHKFLLLGHLLVRIQGWAIPRYDLPEVNIFSSRSFCCGFFFRPNFKIIYPRLNFKVAMKFSPIKMKSL